MENHEGERLPAINAVKRGSFMGNEYLHVGEYDFQYDKWHKQMCYRLKPARGKKAKRWMPIEIDRKNYVEDKQKIIECADKLEEIALQSGSEVGASSEDENASESE